MGNVFGNWDMFYKFENAENTTGRHLQKAFWGSLKACYAMAIMVYVLDFGGPKDAKNTLNSFLTERDKDLFGQIGFDLQKRASKNSGEHSLKS